MTKLFSRVAQLEGLASKKGRLIIAIGPDGFDVDAELALRALVISPVDLVITVNGKPAGSVVEVKVDGVAL